MAPRWPKRAPIWPQEGPRGPQDVPRGPKMRPGWRNIGQEIEVEAKLAPFIQNSRWVPDRVIPTCAPIGYQHPSLFEGSHGAQGPPHSRVGQSVDRHCFVCNKSPIMQGSPDTTAARKQAQIITCTSVCETCSAQSFPQKSCHRPSLLSHDSCPPWLQSRRTSNISARATTRVVSEREAYRRGREVQRTDCSRTQSQKLGLKI